MSEYVSPEIVHIVRAIVLGAEMAGIGASEIVRRANLSRSAVARALRQLQQRGEIELGGGVKGPHCRWGAPGIARRLDAPIKRKPVQAVKLGPNSVFSLGAR